MLSVVLMSLCRMSFCCTVMAVPTLSSQLRYVCLKVWVPILPSPARVNSNRNPNTRSA